MTELQLTNWLKQQTTTLDSIIANAGREFLKDALSSRPSNQFAFDLAECQTESWNLIDGKDLCYDRPNTPFAYSLWYHARRVNTFLTHFIKELYSAAGSTYLEVFDLGAGTGAVQWAIGLVYHKMKTEGIPFPNIRIINVDTSPFMVSYSDRYLWKHFIKTYTHCNDFSENIIYRVNSWNNQQQISISNPWITASYLFDISDNSTTGDYKKAVLESFQEIIETYKPSKFLLLTSVAKGPLVDDVAKEFEKKDYVFQKVNDTNLLLHGSLPAVNQFRIELFNQFQPFFNTSRERSIRNGATWNDSSFVGTIITKRQAEIFEQTATQDGLKLHSTSIKKRKSVELNKEQLKAAKNIEQPTVIIGPAGCGKSIVITERIWNIVKEKDYNPSLRILLTTFNIQLLVQLREWVNDILDSSRILRTEHIEDGVKIFFKGNTSGFENIRILHFDMLPKHLGRVPYWRLVDEGEHNTILRGIISDVKLQNNITDNRHDSLLNPDFLKEEYYRVIYGLQVGIQGSKYNYLSVSRKGRGTALNETKRELVWQCLERYANHIYRNRVPHFVIRRQLFLSELEAGRVKHKFDYVVVDEFQDCTRADFEIFFHLLNNPNNLVIAGDLAQAVHLGKSANIDLLRKAIREDRELNTISWSYLDGSYRLPFRICEAIKKISEHIHLSFGENHAVRILSPYKGAPPGARPIIVMGKDELDVAKKIRLILQQYSLFELNDKCILEKDGLLKYHLGIDSDTVLRLKGLEKQCVIWSTRAPLEHKQEKFEFVYTILTRTSSILIVALFEGQHSKNATQTIFKEAIGLLDKERIIFWDKETKEKFPSFCQQIQSTNMSDEVEV